MKKNVINKIRNANIKEKLIIAMFMLEIKTNKGKFSAAEINEFLSEEGFAIKDAQNILYQMSLDTSGSFVSIANTNTPSDPNSAKFYLNKFGKNEVEEIFNQLV